MKRINQAWDELVAVRKDYWAKRAFNSPLYPTYEFVMCLAQRNKY
jgi:hypothetical protein